MTNRILKTASLFLLLSLLLSSCFFETSILFPGFVTESTTESINESTGGSIGENESPEDTLLLR